MILWSLWVDKDLAVFEGRKEGAVAVCSHAGRLLADFVSFNGLAGGPKRLAMDYLGVGVVARHGQGIVLGAASRHVFHSFSPHVGECLVARGTGLGKIGGVQRSSCDLLTHGLTPIVEYIWSRLSFNKGSVALVCGSEVRNVAMSREGRWHRCMEYMCRREKFALQIWL
ncbi:hypothetical protein TIFTF001_029380 [Ficus carica]|uniref:Uncharacterized protein n=1 Tax=Ficus carica TaxID=3494 RepID=A0AA88J2D2_FICCA|nr:hypothetical protein TIFTF001_029380 [Ficus carica]